MKRLLRIKINQYLNGLNTTEMTTTNIAKYVLREFCLPWDECKKAVAHWQRLRAKEYSNPPVGKEYSGRFIGEKRL